MKYIFILIFSFTHFLVFAQNSERKLVSNQDLKAFFENQNQFDSYLFEENYFLNVEFKQIPTFEQWQNLQASPIKIQDYQGNKVYSVSFPKNISLQTLENLNVKRVLRVDSESKIQKYDFPDSEVLAEVQVFKDISSQKVIQEFKKLGLKIIDEQPFFHIFRILTTKKQVISLSELPFVAYIGFSEKNESLHVLGNNQTKANILSNGVRKLDGSGVNVMVIDGGSIGSHIDFQNQVNNMENVAENFHSTHVLGIMGSAGLRDTFAEGIVPKANFFSYHFSDVPYKMYQAIQNNDVQITQNSYGVNPTTCTGAVYNLEQRLRDQVVNQFPYLLPVFAVGNSFGVCGNSRNTAGNAFKNNISVGGVFYFDELNNCGTCSSSGPTQDGRVKPDIVALGIGVYSTYTNNSYGQTAIGTSQACPAVSAVSAQLAQRYQQIFGKRPPMSLLKASLCNSALDINTLGVDYRSGFGRMDAEKAVLTLEENRFLVNKISTGQSQTKTISVPFGAIRLRAMICWNDPAAAADANPALVNNLNLSVIHSQTSTTWNPWILNPASPMAAATRGIDNLNNIEQVTIDNPQAGDYQLLVNGFAVAMGGTQEYSLVWQIDMPSLELTFPAGNEKLPLSNQAIFGQSANARRTLFRWNADGIASNLTFDYSLDNGNTWNLIVNNIAPSGGTYIWIPPNVTSSQARIRVSSGAYSDISGAFHLIEQPVISSVTSGNNQLTISWNASTTATNYDVYKLNTQNWQYELVGNDIVGTSFVVPNLVNGANYWLTIRAKNNSTNAVSERAVAFSGTPTGAGANNDLSLLAIQNPTNSACLNARSATEIISLQIKNNGTSTITSGTFVTAFYQIDNQTVIQESFITSNWNVNDIFTYNFAQTANFSAEKTYFLSANVQFSGDLLTDNNYLNKKIISKNTFYLSQDQANGICGETVNISAQNLPLTYNLASTTFALQDMSFATTIYVPDNSISDPLSIGFDFYFFGKKQTECEISNDGFLLFNGKTFKQFNSYLAENLPKPSYLNNLIALCWADLNPSPTNIRYFRSGTAPNRKFIVEFLTVSTFYTGKISGQIILNENNTIELQAASITANGLSEKMTMGIENEDGTIANTVSGRNQVANWTATNEGYLFSPNYTSLSWNSGETVPNISKNTAGTYTLSFTQGSCNYSASTTLSNTCGQNPLLNSVFPANNSTNIPLKSNLQFAFNENIFAGTGFITISDGTNSIFLTASDSRVSITKNVVDIQLNQDLLPNKNYFVQINADAFKDNENLFFTGINSPTVWNFSTPNQAPTDIALCAKNLSETTAVGTLIGELSTSDPDANSSFTYAITAGSGIGTFAISENKIYTNAILNYATNPFYTLEISSTDNGISPLSVKKMFQIYVHNQEVFKAGSSQILCAAGSAYTSGVLKPTTAGTWRFISANPVPAILPTIVSPNSPITEISNLQANTDYKFVWQNNLLANACMPEDLAVLNIKVLGNIANPTSTTANWQGAQNTNWYDCRNWQNQYVPNDQMSAQISNSTINIPLISAPYVRIQNLTIDPLQSLQIQTNGVLEIAQNFSNSGVLNNLGNIFISGNFTNSQTLNQSTGKITFSGANSANFVAFASTTLFNVEINKPNSSLNLQNDLFINGQMLFTSGKINSTNSALLVFNDNATNNGGNNLSFVNGKVRKIGDDAFVFPVGKNNYWARIGIENLVSTHVNDYFTAEYFDQKHSFYYVFQSPLKRVSLIEHWILDRGTNGGSGNTGAKVRIFWENNSRSGIDMVTVSDLQVARYNGTTWVSHGNGGISGGIPAGSVLSNDIITSFSPFTEGSSLDNNNLLPLEWLVFTAEIKDEKVKLFWKVLDERETVFYEVQKSKNGVDFENIKQIPSARKSENEYEFWDLMPEGIAYYRIKQTDINKFSTYSKIRAVVQKTISENKLIAFPNPTVAENVNLIVLSKNTIKTNLQMIDVLGRNAFTMDLDLQNGVNEFKLSKIAFAKGVYTLIIKELGLSTKILIE
ncbi:MAG: T9SS C-terminal target domain-containing protein [Bacteroidetes bacterium]|nr:MAG: T9SS C-terminal target domain-containing protein [Bacteroidota bacterium]